MSISNKYFAANYFDIKKRIRLLINQWEYFMYKFSTFNEITHSTVEPNKILLLSHDLSMTGAPVLLYNIANELHRKGYELTLIAKKFGPLAKRFHKMAYLYVKYSDKDFDRLILKLRRRKYENAIVNSVATADWIPNLKKNKFRVVSLIHEMPYVIDLMNLRQNAVIAGTLSDHLIFPSLFVYNKFINISKVTVPFSCFFQGLYTGVNHIVNKDKAKIDLKSIYGITEKYFVLNVATGNYRKGFDLFVELAKQTRNDIAFIWVGDIDKSLLTSINFHYIKNLYLPGYIENQNDLVRFYDSADLFVLTSREEPFGSVVLEAFNSQVPVIGFKDAGGFIEVLHNNITGFLVDFENVRQMSEKINELIENCDLRFKLGENAKKIVKKCSFHKYVENILITLNSNSTDVINEKD